MISEEPIPPPAPPLEAYAAAPYALSPGGHLRIERRKQPHGDVVLVLVGELDIASAQTLASVLRDPDNADTFRVVLDLSGVEFIDSTGISALVRARHRAQDANTELVLTHLPANVSRLFSISGVMSQFTIA